MWWAKKPAKELAIHVPAVQVQKRVEQAEQPWGLELTVPIQW